MKVLIKLKADFKNCTGIDWKPNVTVPLPTTKINKCAEELNTDIQKQGDKVRDLKVQKASKVSALFSK